MRQLTILLVAFFTVGCSSSKVTKTESPTVSPIPIVTQGPQSVSIDSIQQFLLAAAAADFHAHGPSNIKHFRDVRMRYLVSAPGEKTYILCGQFQREVQGGMGEWTAFVTIKTDPYEQWIGGQAATYCRDSSPLSEKVDDLSPLLQSRFDSLK